MKKMALSNVLIIGAQGLGVEIGKLPLLDRRPVSLGGAHRLAPSSPISPLRVLLPTAKNIALAGVKSVTLYDPNPVEVADLGTQFFLRNDDVGSPRAAVTVPRLAELNSYVPVHDLGGKVGETLSEDVLGKYQVSRTHILPIVRSGSFR